jgi:hypothetical protein
MLNFSRLLTAAGFCALSIAAHAQVLWNTTLNPAEESLPLNRTSVVSSEAGSVIMSSFVLTSELARTRVAKLSSTGSEEWVRWVDGVPLSQSESLFSHPDSTVSQLVVTENRICAVNFSSAGSVRAKYCAEGSVGNVSVVRALDGDLIISIGHWIRTVAKYRPDGVVQWSALSQGSGSGDFLGAGIDAEGNYYEINQAKFITFRSTDGAILANVPISDAASAYTGGVYTIRRTVARLNGDVVILVSFSPTDNAIVARVARYGASGVRKWLRDITFPTSSPSSNISLTSVGNDDVLVMREGGSSQHGSEVARLSAAGSVVWQKHLSRISFLKPDSTGLSAIRTDIGASSSDSFIFPVSSVDGTLGAPLIYTRADTFAANSWFPTADGIVAAFQRDGGVPYVAYPDSPASSLVFLRPTAAQRWVYDAKYQRDAQMKDPRCLMPKLAKSSPSAWWARSSEHSPNSGPSWTTRWFGRAATDGSSTAQTPEPANGCGFPVSSDGGQIVVSFQNSPRVKKLSPAGATEWQSDGQQSPTLYPSIQAPVQATSASGETVYAFGNLVGRVNSTGTTHIEALTQRREARFLATDAAGDALVVYGDNPPAVAKVSSSGSVLWTTNITIPSCNNELVTTRKLNNDDILIGTQSCGEGRLFRVNANGAIAWQRIVSGDFVRPYVRLLTLNEDAQGNVYAGGCMGTLPDAQDASGMSLLSSWSASGVERWTQRADLSGANADCVSSISNDATGNVVAIVTAASGGAPLVWSLNTSGVERWRHNALLANPNANEAEAAIDEAGNLIVLGQSPRNEFGGSSVTLRKISLASAASTQRVKFLEVPSAPIGFRVPFSVRIGLRSDTDQPSVAASNVRVQIGLNSGTGNLDGALECTVPMGSSECVASGVLYNKVETNVSLTAWADGMPSAMSGPLSFVAAPTTTTMVIEPANAITAYDVRVIRTSILSTTVRQQQGQTGYIQGPYAAGFNSIRNCNNALPAPGTLAASNCDVLLRTETFPITASYQGNLPEIDNSQSTLSAPQIAKAQAVLAVVEDPQNTGVAGDRVRFRVQLQTATGFNLVRYVQPSQIGVSSGNCNVAITASSNSFNEPNNYYVCDASGLGAGSHSVTFSFAGDSDLLPAQSVTRSIALTAGGVIRGQSIPSGASVCSPTPGINCAIVSPPGNGWQCVGPPGMSGQLFFVPQNGNNYVFSDSPLSFSNVTGVMSFNQSLDWSFEWSSCKLDADGDGARLAGTDGLIILRRMMQLSGNALVAGAPHSCVPLTPAGIATRVNVAAYDIDGNGVTDPSTDGLMLMRILLGFRGDAVVTGATAANATRTTWQEVRDFMQSSCNFYMP